MGNRLRLNRSGSMPSQKQVKEADICSVSTLTGTLPSHKSDKRIEDLDSKTQQVVPVVKLPNFTKANQQALSLPLLPANSSAPHWLLSSSGCLTSRSHDITTIKYYFMRTAAKS